MDKNNRTLKLLHKCIKANTSADFLTVTLQTRLVQQDTPCCVTGLGNIP